MSAEDKKSNEVLSRIVAELFAAAKGGEDLSSKINGLRSEIKKVLEHEDTVFGKFYGVAESFREIIPDERQRYSAAIKALLATSKINRQEIARAVTNQLEELKILEKILLESPSGRRGEVKAMEARSLALRDEIAKLREKISRLESEDKEITSSIVERGKGLEVAEKAVGELFAEIGAEITYMKKKVEEPPTVERMIAPRPVPPADSVIRGTASEETAVSGQTSGLPAPSAPQAAELQKTCPMCGGRMDLQMNGEIWLCYSCAHEEAGDGAIPEKSEKKSPLACEPKPTPAPSASLFSESIRGSIGGSSPFNQQPAAKKKDCPSCRKKMNWHENESAWRCPFCEYERRI